MASNPSKDLNNQAVQHFLEGRMEEAKVCYLQALGENPENATAWNNLGLLHHYLNESTQAIDSFAQALSIEEKPIFLLNSGNSHLAIGNLSEAGKQYLAATKLDPSYTKAWIALAKLALCRQVYSEAIQFWNRVLTLDSRPEYHLELAKSLILNQEFEKALERLSELDAHADPEVWFQIGRCEYLLRNHGLAERAFKAALAQSPDSLEYRRHLALNYLSSGQFEKGLEQFDLILKLNPESHEAWTDKGVVLCGFSRFEDARSCFETALGLVPEYPKAQHYLKLTNLHRPNSK